MCKVQFFRVDPQTGNRITAVGGGPQYTETTNDVGFKLLAVAHWEGEEITRDLGLVE